MREQQLFTKQDLYTRYSYKCDSCNKNVIDSLDKYYVVHRQWWDVEHICRDCAKSLLTTGRDSFMFYKGEIYARNAWVPTRNCIACNKLMYNDWCHQYCAKCATTRQWCQSTYYCMNCWCVHDRMHNGICNCWISNNYELLNNAESTSILNMSTSRESKNRAPKGIAKNLTDADKITVMRSLPFQEERKLPLYVLEDLEDFYQDNYHDDCQDWYFDNYFYWQPTEITGEIHYKRYDWLAKFRDKLYDIEDYWEKVIKEWKKANKYRNHYFQDISDDWLITWKYIDMFGWIREKKESINKFLQDNNLPVDKISLNRSIYYRLSSDINHKLISFDINNRLGSCQQPHNSESYAAWAYDAVTNWCNCPILIYNSKEDCDNKSDPIWRITSRIMYDEDWQMYILIDRLYQDWSLSWAKIKWMMYKLIIEDLKNQWYKVIVTNYSAHDSSTLQYVEALGLHKQWEIKNLWQPLRRLMNVNGEDGTCGYYSDWWIEVYQADVNWLTRATDYLDKGYLL